MLKDASHQQVIEKFSFIPTLSLSRSKARGKATNPSPQVDRLSEEDLANLKSLLNEEHKFADFAASTKSSSPNSSSLTTIHKTATIDTTWYQTEPNPSAYSLNLATIGNVEPADNLENNDRLANYLDKILLAFAGCYLIFVAWWLWGSQGRELWAMFTDSQRVTISEADAQFIDYMERSLQAITRETENLAQENDDKLTSQVVYVPIYKPTSGTPNLPYSGGSSFPANPVSPTITPPLPPSTLPTIQSKIANPPSSPVKLPSPPPPPEAKSPKKPVATTSIAPKIDRSLIGILELGQQSAALFKINGNTKRVWVGEKIDSSGWILESVTQQQAKISRDGSLKNISVGEKF